MAARALAFLRGRDYVHPQDVVDMVPDVFRHRLVLSYEAMADYRRFAPGLPLSAVRPETRYGGSGNPDCCGDERQGRQTRPR